MKKPRQGSYTDQADASKLRCPAGPRLAASGIQSPSTNALYSAVTLPIHSCFLVIHFDSAFDLWSFNPKSSFLKDNL